MDFIMEQRRPTRKASFAAHQYIYKLTSAPISGDVITDTVSLIWKQKGVAAVFSTQCPKGIKC